MSKATRYSFTFAPALLFVMLFSAYSNTFYSPPVLDDFHSFVFPQSLRLNEWSVNTIKGLGQTVFGWGRWIPVLTFSWDLWLGEGELPFLHLTNLLIHSFCFLAIFFLISQVAKSVERNNPSQESILRARDLALWVGGLWALHPVQTNAVTYLVQRMASLVTLFYVLCVAFYIAGRLTQLDKGRLDLKAVAFYFFSFFSMVLAFLSKQNAAMIPAMLFFTEAWLFTPDLIRRLFVLSRKHKLITAFALLVMMIGLWHIWPMLVGGYEARHFTPGQRLLTEARVVIWYISILLYPHPSRLSLEHDTIVSTSLFDPMSTLFSIILLAGLATFAVLKRKRFPLITYGIVWFLLNMVIESSFLSLELVFEHRLYLSSLGLFLSIVVALWDLTRKISLKISDEEFKKLAWCMVAILASTLSMATFERNNAWQDSVTLNQDNVLKAPDNPRAHANLALALARAQRYEEALPEARMAIQLGHDGYESYFVAANVIVSSYNSLGKYETAITEGEKLINENSPLCDKAAWPNLSMNIAMAYTKAGDISSAYNTIRRALADYSKLPKNDAFYVDGAIQLLRATLYAAREKGIELNKSTAFDQNSASLDTWITQILIELGYRDEAKKLLEKTVRANEQDEQGKRILQTLVEEDRLNKIQEAKKNFTQEYVQHPFSRFNACMAIAFVIQKKHLPSYFMALGQVLLDHAFEMKPDSTDAYLLKGWYHHERNEAEQAVAAARRALELDPYYARAWLGLGFFLSKANNTHEAVTAFQRSLELYPGCPERRTIVGIVATMDKSEEGQKAMAKDEHVRMN